MVVPENGILRDPVQHTVMPSPFIKGIVPLIIFFFFVVSLAYGIATGKIRRQADLPQLMIEPMKEMAGFIVMVFRWRSSWRCSTGATWASLWPSV